MKPEIVKEAHQNKIESCSKQEYDDEITEIKELLSQDVDVLDRLESIENYSRYGVLTGNENILVGSALAGFLSRVMIDFGREGRNIQRIVFEKLHFGLEDNPSVEELYYRRVWNRAILNQKFMNRIIIWSFLLEIDSKFHRLIMEGLNAYMLEESSIEASKHVVSKVRNI